MILKRLVSQTRIRFDVWLETEPNRVENGNGTGTGRANPPVALSKWSKACGTHSMFVVPRRNVRAHEETPSPDLNDAALLMRDSHAFMMERIAKDWTRPIAASQGGCHGCPYVFDAERLEGRRSRRDYLGMLPCLAYYNVRFRIPMPC
jgi:hypothetical protein